MNRLVRFLASATAASAAVVAAVCGSAAGAAHDSTSPANDVIADGRGFDWDPAPRS